MIKKMIKKMIKNLICKHEDVIPLDIMPGSFDEYKCIFIHIPKAAGSSLCLSMFGSQIGHIKYSDYLRENNQKTQEYFKFTFVRNPWDRVLSAYTFLKNGGMNDQDSAWAEENLSQYDDFNEFVYDWINEKNILTQVHFVPQIKYIEDPITGVIKMNFIGRVENIQNDLNFITKRLGVKNVELKKLNTSNHSKYQEVYNEKSKKIIERVYAEDIYRFGYKF